MKNLKRIHILLVAALSAPGALFADEAPQAPAAPNTTRPSTAITPPPRPERPRGVSAAPNETTVVGKVEIQCTLLSSLLGIKPEMNIYRVRLAVERVESGSPLRQKSRRLLLLSKQELPPLVGATARATIEYRGDEKGGAYWLRSMEKVD